MPNCYMNVKDSLLVYLFHREAKKKGIPIIDRSLKIKPKKGKKIFILGSGESIANLNDDDWQHIKDHDTAALNYFYVHDFTPNIMFVELNMHSGLVELFERNCVEEDRFSNTRIILQYKHARRTKIYDKSNTRKKVESYIPVNLAASSKDEFSRLYANRNKAKFVHHASHVCALVDFCISEGYEQIILIGVDLNGGKYFYEAKSKSKNYPENKKYHELDIQRKDFFTLNGESNIQVHQSMMKSLSSKYSNLNVYEYFEVINKFHPGVLAVYNQDSKLSELFPIYKSQLPK